ncbi:MAG TPA: hypothetical protein P5218_07325 [Planctomycetota bacterium]|nr:hypothetical protein [Planctomycetota bacterium]
MAAKLFVPLELLAGIETDARDGGSQLTLSRAWDPAEFEGQARGLAQALDARIGTQASDERTHVWELDIDGQPFHLCLDARGLAHLESRSPAARLRLPQLREQLLVWAGDQERGLAGRFVPALPALLPRAGATEGGDEATRKRAFVWRRGVLGFGLGAGVCWLLAMWGSGTELNLGVRLAVGLGGFPLVGYLWATRFWNQGRA